MTNFFTFLLLLVLIILNFCAAYNHLKNQQILVGLGFILFGIHYCVLMGLAIGVSYYGF